MFRYNQTPWMDRLQTEPQILGHPNSHWQMRGPQHYSGSKNLGKGWLMGPEDGIVGQIGPKTSVSFHQLVQ